MNVNRAGRGIGAAALVGCATAALALAAPAPGAGLKKERLRLDTYAPGNVAKPVKTKRPLTRGKWYLVSVTGTYSVYARTDWAEPGGCGTPDDTMYRSPRRRSGKTGTDGEWLFAFPAPRKADCTKVPDHTPQLLMKANRRFTHPDPVDRSDVKAPDPTHRYRYVIKGAGKRAIFKVSDSPTFDNYGVLRITVQRAPRNLIPGQAPVPVPTPTPTPSPSPAPTVTP